MLSSMAICPFGLSVKVLVYDNLGRALAIQRSRQSSYWAGKWDLPGGKIDEGETFDHAMLRETREETSLNVRLERFVGAADWDLPHIRLVFLIMSATILGGEFKLSEEHEDYRWLEQGTFHTLDWVDPIALVLRDAKLG